MDPNNIKLNKSIGLYLSKTNIERINVLNMKMLTIVIILMSKK